MNIKAKVIIIVGTSTLILCCILFTILAPSFLRTYAGIEDNLMSQNLERIHFALNNEESALQKQSADWGFWDDTYSFVEDRNQEYIQNNFADQTFISIETNIIAIVNTSGELVFAENFDLDKQAPGTLSKDVEQAITNQALLSHSVEDEKSGIISTEDGPLLVGTSPILNSLGEGPARGTVIMGKFLDQKLIEKLSTITKLPVSFSKVDEINSVSSGDVPELSSENPVAVKASDPNTLDGYIFVPDVYGQPFLAAGTTMAREVYSQGRAMIMWMLLGMAAVACLIILINIRLLDLFILKRIKQLKNFASRISGQSQSDMHIVLKGKDEITDLGNELNRMLQKLFAINDQLGKSELKYKLLVENQSDLLLEITPEGKLLFANPAYCKLTGKSKEDLLGTTVGAIFPDTVSGPETVPGLSGVIYSESPMTTPWGVRWIAWTGNKILDDNGQVVSLTCLGRDVTASKLAKEELEEANRQLVELSKLKDNFLSTVSHELRTPLTSIKSFAQILLTYDEDKETQKEFLNIINDESDRLTRLINDFLDLSKIQSGKMQWRMSALSIAEVIHSAVAVSMPLIQRSKLELSVNIEPDLPPVICDKDRLVQVITNLLGNANKFTPENGKITVWVRADQIAGDAGPKSVLVSVTDTGIGIAPENHHLIFENFVQVGDVLKDRPKGTGLGLSICKKMIENMGGKIWFESSPGQGTTFTFCLPVADEKSAVPPQPSNQYPANSPDSGRLNPNPFGQFHTPESAPTSLKTTG